MAKRRGRNVVFRDGECLIYVPGVGLVPGPARGRVPAVEPYPETVAECLVDGKTYKPAALAALRAFRAAKPWQGPLSRRRRLFRDLHEALCAAYGLGTAVRFEVNPGEEGDSSLSSYAAGLNRITIRGRLSVLTYLHEFGHALGHGERGACIWSINLFRRMFPRSFARLIPVGHTLRRVES